MGYNGMGDMRQRKILFEKFKQVALAAGRCPDGEIKKKRGKGNTQEWGEWKEGSLRIHMGIE